jgi:uncharacterized protein (TIGR00369 family)
MGPTTTDTAEPATGFLPGLPEALFRVHPVAGTASSVTGSMRTGRWTHGPAGRPTFGALGVLLDVVLGVPLIAARPPGHWGVTTSMSVEFCAPLPDADSILSASGHTVFRTAAGGVSHGSVLAANGDTVAIGSLQLRFVPRVPTPDRRAAAMPGTDAERPILDLLDAAAHRADSGVELHLRTGPNVTNPLGNLHGGIALCLSEIAASIAVRSDTHPLEPARLDIAYIRPGPSRGVARFTTEVVYRGRTSAVVRVDCRRPADDKACAVATVTYRGSPD